MEGIPSVLLGFLVLALLDNGPKQAKWLKTEERDLLARRLQEDESSKQNYGQKHHFLALSATCVCGRWRSFTYAQMSVSMR